MDPRFEQLRMLTAISRALTYTTSLDQVTHLTVERGAELLDATAAVLMLADTDGMQQVRAAHGISEEQLRHLRAPWTGGDAIDRVTELLEVSQDRFIVVPLVVGGGVTGLIAVAMDRDVATADEWLLSALADQAAVALENARLGGEVRVEMEERLRVSEGATSAKDRALSTLAHDIRTPLGAIEGYCGILEAEIYGPINERQRETLGRVRLSGRHLLSLLDNVMDMARIDAGLFTLDVGPTRLRDTAREAVQMLTPAADARLQTLHLGDTSDVVVNADQDRLRQVLVNLIGNAVKFTPQSGTITVTTADRTVDGRRYGEICVTDTGPGIPAAECAAIFEPYYRSESTARAAGVGLGLAISHGLVQQMGGEITVESEPGQGSRFTVRLKRA